ESFVQGSTHRKGDAYTFVVDVAGPHPQVLELAWDLPKHPFPSTAKKAPFAIDGSVIDPSADAATNAALASLVLAVRTHPQCLWEEAARAPSSPVLAIEATKTEGTETTVRLYPTSDPVSASLLACLETELTDVAKAKIKAKRFAIEGVLHVYLDPKTMPTKSFSFSGTKQL
ncbi:MAG TPA: hypothetical protein VF407_13285, partial [Polyangiaceae bacterium]